MSFAIQVQSLSKRYRTGRGNFNLGSLFKREKHSYHWALRDLNFTLRPGESLGIIGPNGSGKTTTLKILSKVTHPTSGTMQVKGRMSALIELGAGFHPDLSGRENIFLNGTILGMSRAEIRRRFAEIVDFAGIGGYLDTPVKRYSSGMYARLGFAIAAYVDPQILLVDEVLAVGDYAFQMKCHARMDKLRESGTALIFVSHNFEAVRRVCDRGLVLYQGNPIFQGSASDAIVAYSDAVRQAARQSKVNLSSGGLSQKVMTFEAEIKQVQMLTTAHEPAKTFESGEQAYILVDVTVNQHIERPVFGLFIRTPDGRKVYVTTTRWQEMETGVYPAGSTIQVTYLLNLPLVDGHYELGVDIAAHDLSHYYDRAERALTFRIAGTNAIRGVADLSAQITITPM